MLNIVSPKTIQSLIRIALLLGLIYLLNEFLGRPVWLVTLLFDVDREATIQAWFSSMLWMLCALTAWDISRAVFRDRVSGFAWKLFSALFLFFSMDETSMIHERLTQTAIHFFSLKADFPLIWPIVLSPLLLLAGIAAWRISARAFDFKKAAHRRILIGGCVFLSGALGVEFLDIFYYYPGVQSFRAIQVFLEESLEMLGALIILSGLSEARLWAGTSSIPEKVPFEMRKAS